MAPERVNFRKGKHPPKDARGRIAVSLDLVDEMDNLIAELQEVRPHYSLSKPQIVEAGIRHVMESIRRDIAAFREVT
jgi:hypothetical protein